MFRFGVILPVAAALVLVAGGVVACGGSDDDDDAASPAPTTVSAQPTQGTSGGGSPTQAGGGTKVTIVDFGYGPEAITARAGQALTVDLTNNGQAPHTFTITGVVDSGTINTGQSKSVSFTPSAAGSLQFFCTIHGVAAMSGRVTVQ